MALGLPLSYEDFDLMTLAAGFFVALIIFGILQKSKILGRSKTINLALSLIIGIYAMSNEYIVSFMFNLSSNIAILALLGLVVVVMLFISGVSMFTIFIVFLIMILFLINTSIYPFYLIMDYLPTSIIKLVIIICAVIAIISLALSSKN